MKPKAWIVQVTRTSQAQKFITVTAPTAEAARRIAVAQAPDETFSNHISEYNAQKAEDVKENGAYEDQDFNKRLKQADKIMKSWPDWKRTLAVHIMQQRGL